MLRAQNVEAFIAKLPEGLQGMILSGSYSWGKTSALSPSAPPVVIQHDPRSVEEQEEEDHEFARRAVDNGVWKGPEEIGEQDPILKAANAAAEKMATDSFDGAPQQQVDGISSAQKLLGIVACCGPIQVAKDLKMELEEDTLGQSLGFEPLVTRPRLAAPPPPTRGPGKDYTQWEDDEAAGRAMMPENIDGVEHQPRDEDDPALSSSWAPGSASDTDQPHRPDEGGVAQVTHAPQNPVRTPDSIRKELDDAGASTRTPLFHGATEFSSLPSVQQKQAEILKASISSSAASRVAYNDSIQRKHVKSIEELTKQAEEEFEAKYGSGRSPWQVKHRNGDAQQHHRDEGSDTDDDLLV